MAELVQTTFAIMDQASGPLNQMAGAASHLAEESERAQRATEKTGQSPLAGGHGGGGSERAIPRGSTAAEQERFAEAKEEFGLLRQRRRLARLEMHEGHAAHRAGMAASMLLATESNGMAAQLGRGAMAIQMAGAEFMTMGGQAGVFGEQLLKAAGPLTAVVAGWEIGHVVGEKLTEGAEWLATKFEGMGATGEALDTALGVFTLGLYTIITDDARIHAENLKNNEVFAKALGYRSAAEYGQAQAIHSAINHEMKFGREIAAAADKLGAMPTDETSEAMRAFKERALKAALEIGRTGEDVKTAFDALLKAAPQTAASFAGKDARDSQIADLASHDAMAIANDTYVATQQERIEAVRKAVEQELQLKNISEAEQGALYQKLTADLASSASTFDLQKTLAEEDRRRMRMNELIEQYSKSIGKGADTIDVSNRIAEFTMRGYQQMLKEGLVDSPERVQRAFHDQLLSKRLEKAEVKMDFRGSKFEIEQKFAQGFDPDRIAVAFASDLARMGEMKVMSGFVPINSVR